MLRSRERWLHDNHFFFGEFKRRVVLLWDVSFVSLIHQIAIVMVGHE